MGVLFIYLFVPSSWSNNWINGHNVYWDYKGGKQEGFSQEKKKAKQYDYLVHIEFCITKSLFLFVCKNSDDKD